MLDPTRVPLSQEPLLLRTNAQLFSYVDLFVSDYLGLAQGPIHWRCHMRRTPFHALDKVFRPLEKLEPNERKEFLSLKKLDSSECLCSTCQVLVSRVVDTLNMTM